MSKQLPDYHQADTSIGRLHRRNRTAESEEMVDEANPEAAAEAASLKRSRRLLAITALSLAIGVPLTTANLDHQGQSPAIEQSTPAPEETETLNDVLDGQLDKLVLEPSLQSLQTDPGSPSRVTLKVHAKQNVGAHSKLASYEEGGNVKVKTRLVARPLSLGGAGLMSLSSPIKWVASEPGASSDKTEDQLSGTALWNADPNKVPPSGLVAIAHESTLMQHDGDATWDRTTDVVDGVARVTRNDAGDIVSIVPVENNEVQPGDIFSSDARGEELSRT